MSTEVTILLFSENRKDSRNQSARNIFERRKVIVGPEDGRG